MTLTEACPNSEQGSLRRSETRQAQWVKKPRAWGGARPALLSPPSMQDHPSLRHQLSFLVVFLKAFPGVLWARPHTSRGHTGHSLETQDSEEGPSLAPARCVAQSGHLMNIC